MSERPWFQCFPSDFLNGVADLSPAEIAVYTIIMMRMYDEMAPVPDDAAKIARRCNMGKAACARAIGALVNSGKLRRENGFLLNDRVQKELKKIDIKSKQSSAAAKMRWRKEAKKTSESNDDAIETQGPGRCETDACHIPQARDHKERTLKGSKESTLVGPKEGAVPAEGSESRAEENASSAGDEEPVALRPGARRKSKRVPVLAALQIDREMERWAAGKTPGIDLALELEKFRNWHRARGRRLKDYRAGFRNWLLKAVEIRARDGQGGYGSGPGGYGGGRGPAGSTDSGLWLARVTDWKDSAVWLDIWGPAPDAPGTQVPESVLRNSAIGRGR